MFIDPDFRAVFPALCSRLPLSSAGPGRFPRHLRRDRAPEDVQRPLGWSVSLTCQAGGDVCFMFPFLETYPQCLVLG